MKRLWNKVKGFKGLKYIIIILVSLIASIPLLKMQLVLCDDGYVHMLRIMGMSRVFQTGQFPPLINPDYCSTWGYAINLFYAPLVTYIPYILKLFVMHFYDAMKIYAAITTLVSGLAMYKCAKEITKKDRIALFASIIYILYPYRLETMYNRFAIGEFSAYMFIPFVFLGLNNLLKGDKKRHYFISIGAIGLILTHSITTEMVIIFSVIYLLINVKALKNKEVIKKIVINALIVIGLTAFYTIPILEYKVLGDYTIFHADIMHYDNESVRGHSITMLQLIKDDENYVDKISVKLGVPIVALILMGIFTGKKIEKEDYKIDYVLFTLFALMSVFMSLNIFPWMYMPKFLCVIQFAWRMLEFFGFFISIICAINAYQIIEIVNNKSQKKRTALYLLFLILIILGSITMITRYKSRNLNYDKRIEKNLLDNPQISYYQINRDYLPVKAGNQEEAYLLTRKNNVVVIDGETDILNEQKNDLKISFNIDNAKQGTILEMPYLYYLGYKAKIVNEDNSVIELKTFESDNGFVAIQIPNDIKTAKIIVEYKGTTLEKIGYVISGLTIVITLIYLIEKRKNGEKTIEKE